MHIRNMERFIARSASRKELAEYRMRLAGLNRERALIVFEQVMLGGIVAQLAAEKEKEKEEKEKEVRKVALRLVETKVDEEKEDDDHGDYTGDTEGYEMHVKVEDFDDDSEIERQIQDNIALSQRSC
jgi:hypothetical protein